MSRLPLLIACAVAAACLSGSVKAEEGVDFVRDVEPILRAHCGECHGATKQKGGLRFDSREGAFAKADSGGPAIVPGQPGKSELIARVTSDDPSLRMPPEGDPLSPSQIATLRRWIERGAVWPNVNVPATRSAGLVITEADRRHWSFLPLLDVQVPEVRQPRTARNEIDSFILAALEARGLPLSKPADPRTLVRRLTFDLTGLPPTPEEVDEFVTAFEQDPETAWDRIVDRLLSSPHFGERWGRHWLDVARYADSNGQEGDQDRPFAYQYRDFVIRAFNEDLPYDTFVRWQLAGDEYEPDNPLAVSATGFLVAGPHTVLTVPMEEEKIRNRYNELDDMLGTIGTGMLGLTLGCARCHDHKYDAISARDYYRLLCALHSGDRKEVLLGSRDEIQEYLESHAAWEKRRTAAQAEWSEWLLRHRKQLEPALKRKKVEALKLSASEKTLLHDQPGSDKARALAKKHARELSISDEELLEAADVEARSRGEALRSDLQRVEREEPKSLPQAYVFQDVVSQPKPTWLFQRGDFSDRDEPVELGFLEVLTATKDATAYWKEARASNPRAKSTYQRRALAEWITDTGNGAGMLLARVIVNRVWQHHFGEGLVRTPSDFGVQGERPSHPELLEWLAKDFVTNGWRLKRLHRQMLNSATWRQAGEWDALKAKLDPENRFLWRRRPKRLEAEVLRDSMLAIGGTLNRQVHGPAFKPPIAAEAMVARNLKTPYVPERTDSPNVRRRSVYMFHKRVVPYPLLLAFDRPDALQSCGRRDATTVAPQALALLNDQFVRDCAASFASRLAEKPVAERVRAAWELAISRPPSDFEFQASLDFLDQRAKSRGAEAMTDFCQTLFCLNEFLYVD